MMLEKLRLINNKFLEIRTDENDKVKYQLIKKILNDDKCFFKMGIEQAYAILRDLDFSEDELKGVYSELIDYKNY